MTQEDGSSQSEIKSVDELSKSGGAEQSEAPEEVNPNNITAELNED